MKKENQNKIKLLKLWEILSMDSDEDNPLSTGDILARLKEQGIVCDRRTLYNDIKTLNDFGYEVICELKNHSNHYYVCERGFDMPELKILMDAMTAANFIPTQKTILMHNKIAALAGSNRAELLKKSQTFINLTKRENEVIYFIVNELNEAILSGNKVTFQYFDLNSKGERVCRKDGNRYLVNPVSTVFSDDRYYLVAFSDKHNALTHYRIDKMQHIKIEDDKILTPDWLKNTDLAEYKKQLFSMFGGDTEHVTFEADNSLADIIFDKFGIQTQLFDIGNNRFMFSANIQISPVFIGWCLSFKDLLKIVHPTALIKTLNSTLKTLNMLYPLAKA